MKKKKAEPPAPKSPEPAQLDALGLIGLQPVFDLLSLALWSGQVIGERPVSLLVVAPVASGKTSLLEKLECEQSHFCSDITSREVNSILSRPRVTHILLGDLLSLFGHKSHVVNLTCRTLSSLTGETMRTDSFSGKETNRMLGLISAIPPAELLKDNIRRRLDEGGLSTRFIFARYKYSNSTIAAIHDFIKSDAYTRVKPFRFIIDRAPAKVEIRNREANDIREIAIGIQEPTDKIGTRPHHHMRALTKASALSNGRATVTREDVERVARHSNFFTHEGVDI